MDALDMITETETSFFSVFVSSYYFLCVRHGPSQENNGSSECQLLVSPGPNVSVCDPQQVMDTDQQVAATPAPGDHWDLISELLSAQEEAGHTNIILASYKPSSRAACVVYSGHYQQKSSPPPLLYFFPALLFLFLAQKVSGKCFFLCV